MGNEQSREQESELPKGLAKPAQRALAQAGFFRLEQLAKVSEAELLKLHGMGPKTMGQLRAALAEKGLSFAE
ncbi:helix-hairpin-helix domain-containing protein [Brevibacillus centrosporus]|uniref:helix-hairpin-helix domain-containing protein n=1 Tax=Brevibacillus centrosporus TaxID=54910 RepID=UPI0038131770